MRVPVSEANDLNFLLGFLRSRYERLFRKHNPTSFFLVYIFEYLQGKINKAVIKEARAQISLQSNSLCLLVSQVFMGKWITLRGLG